MIKKTIKNHVSEIDKRLAKFDLNRPKSFAERAEIAKYNRISELRDNPKAHSSEKEKDLFDF